MVNTTSNMENKKMNMISINFLMIMRINMKYKMNKKRKNKLNNRKILMKMARMWISTITKESTLMMMQVKSINVQKQEHTLNQKTYAGEFTQSLIRGSHLK